MNGSCILSRAVKVSKITVFFRGSKKGDEPKVCVILKAPEGDIEKFIEANAPMIAASGHVLERTTVNINKS